MTVAVEVAGRVLQVSSLDRVLWPATGTTKAELLEHYLRTAPLLLPHLSGRPLTLHRYPEGLGGPHFFQTRTPPHPPWLRTATMSFPRTGKTFEAPVVDDAAGLVWAVNLSTIELHPFLGRLPRLDLPTALVVDLDPGPPAGLVEACAVALLARAELDAAGLTAYPKSSGGKGLHLHVPVHGVPYAETKGVARGLARTLAGRHPELVVDRMTRALRPGKVLIDWSQNDPGKSTVAPWSVRGQVVPTVAAPVPWSAVERAAATGDARPLVVRLDELDRHLDASGDLFAPLAAAVSDRAAGAGGAPPPGA